MLYQFEFRPYTRKFTPPLTTNHGIWEHRESIILRLTDATGRVGWGEIAPISWFGSETLEQALDFCHQLSGEITYEAIFSISEDLPACQFGFESALERVGGKMTNPHNLTYSGLLPAGKAAIHVWQSLWEQGYRTFKWKIGVDAVAKELEIFDLLIRTLPNSAKLRLDANGGLSYEEAKLWLETCDKFKAQIEFIEQPLSVGDLAGMLRLSECYEIAIALDESVATLKQLESCFQQGWRGIFVIKVAIVGSPSRLRQFCQQHQLDLVFSSVFETAIGRQAALQLAAELSPQNRAVGFGTNHFFAQEESNWLQSLWNKF